MTVKEMITMLQQLPTTRPLARRIGAIADVGHGDDKCDYLENQVLVLLPQIREVLNRLRTGQDAVLRRNANTTHEAARTE